MIEQLIEEESNAYSHKVSSDTPESIATSGTITPRIVISGADAVSKYANAVGRYDVSSEAITDAVKRGCRFVFVKSPTGGGKSQAAKRFINELRGHVKAADRPQWVTDIFGDEPRELTVAAPTLRRSLADTAATRWDLDNYQDKDHGCDRISFCADSIEKSIKNDGYDVVLVDEWHSLNRHICGETIGKNSQTVFHMFASMLHQSKIVIIMDAMIGDDEYKAFAQIMGCSDHQWMMAHCAIVDDTRKRAALSPLAITEVDHKSEGEVVIARNLAEGCTPFIWAFDSRGEAQAQHTRLTEMFSDREWLIITSDKNEQAAAFCADPDGYIKSVKRSGRKWGGILHTSAMESGVSITESLSDDEGHKSNIVIGSFSGKNVTWTAALQMMSRYRCANAWVINAAPVAACGDTDAKRVLDSIMLDSKRRARIGSHYVWGKNTPSPACVAAPHTQYYAGRKAAENRLRSNFGFDLFQYLVSEGYAPEFAVMTDKAADEEIREDTRVAREQNKQSRIDGIIAADCTDIDPESAKTKLQGALSDGERFACEKSVIADFYCDDIDDLDRDIVEFDDEGNGRGCAIKYNRARAVIDGVDGISALIEARYVKITAGVSAGIANGITAVDVLRAVGITDDVILGEHEGSAIKFTHKQPVDLDNAAVFKVTPESLRAYFRLVCTPDGRAAVKSASSHDPWGYMGDLGEALISGDIQFDDEGNVTRAAKCAIAHDVTVGEPISDDVLTMVSYNQVVGAIIRGMGGKAYTKRSRKKTGTERHTVIDVTRFATVRKYANKRYEAIYGDDDMREFARRGREIDAQSDIKPMTRGEYSVFKQNNRDGANMFKVAAHGIHHKDPEAIEILSRLSDEQRHRFLSYNSFLLKFETNPQKPAHKVSIESARAWGFAA